MEEEEEGAPMADTHHRNSLDSLDAAAVGVADGRDIQAAVEGTL